MPNKLTEAGISWVILGSQTKPYRPPTIKAVQEIVQVCDKAGTKVFLKKNLKPLLLEHLFDTKAWAFRNHQLRQEMPK